ncbi:PTS sugar transporter subunit IIA [Allofustis seminis]|uniref:PTS sugar transporter subunit IIA n=1 Tax=Allofustis seminis TaxID=166939 RepID=UPI00035D3D0C|nr:PTS sugar transporter subunit IIA [Allofustis seminis]
MKEYISKDEIYISNAKRKEDLFKEIYDHLFSKNLVTEKFLIEIIERENRSPTGLNLSHMSKKLPSIAIPHTDYKFCNVDLVVPVSLNTKIEFNNMINPDQKEDVGFIFMILNSHPGSQVEMLPSIMNFLKNQTVDNLASFFKLTNERDIFNYINSRDIKGEWE